MSKGTELFTFHPLESRQLIVSFLIMMATVSLWAAEPSDSTEVKTLDEVEVVGENQSINLQGAVYIPTKKAKEMADGGLELLKLMQLPQLRYEGSPGQETFTTTDGNQVSYFINGRPASDQEMRMLLAKDALRIEFLDHPADPIFRGASYVLNFIMKVYEFGGYTKLSATNAFNNNFDQFNGSLYSKFAYKKMEYDVIFWPRIAKFSHSGSNDNENYRIKDNSGEYKEEWRNSSFLNGNNANNQFPVNIRARYSDKTKFIDNTIGFLHSGNPGSTEWSKLTFSNSLLGDDYTSEKWIYNQGNSIGWYGQYVWHLPKGWGLAVDPSINYSHSRNINRYSTTLDSFSPLNNNSLQDVYNYNISIFTANRLRNIHYLQLGVNTGYSDSHIEYYGSRSQKERIGQFNLLVMPSYQVIVNRFRIGVGASLGLYSTRIYGNTDSEFSPSGTLSVRYNPNKKTAFSFRASYLTSPKPTYMISSVVNRINEFLYQTGNDKIKGPKNLNINLNYLFFPSNFFNLNIFANYNADFNRVVQHYDSYMDGKAVIRTYLNSGDFTTMRIGGNFTFKLIDGNLTIQLNPEMSYSHSSGIYRYHLLAARGNVSANYFFRNVVFSMMVYTPHTSIDSSTPTKTKFSRWGGDLGVSWSHKNLSLSIDIEQPWESSYNFCTSNLQTSYYTKNDKSITPISNWAINLKLSYTLDYGKKIDRNNELQLMNFGGSSILQ